jgi:hypothetical protein
MQASAPKAFCPFSSWMVGRSYLDGFRHREACAVQSPIDGASTAVTLLIVKAKQSSSFVIWQL